MKKEPSNQVCKKLLFNIKILNIVFFIINPTQSIFNSFYPNIIFFHFLINPFIIIGKHTNIIFSNLLIAWIIEIGITVWYLSILKKAQPVIKICKNKKPPKPPKKITKQKFIVPKPLY